MHFAEKTDERPHPAWNQSHDDSLRVLTDKSRLPLWGPWAEEQDSGKCVYTSRLLSELPSGVSTTSTRDAGRRRPHPSCALSQEKVWHGLVGGWILLYLKEITFGSNATSAPRGNFIISDSVVAEFFVSQLAGWFSRYVIQQRLHLDDVW